MIAPCPTLEALITRLRSCVRTPEPPPGALCRDVAASLAPALRDPTWLPADLTIPDPSSYRRERLHEEDDGAFSIGCFVWGAGQATPIHDHRSWGVAGVLVGTLREESFVRGASGKLEKLGPDAILRAGEIGAVDPGLGDIHRIGAATGEVSISIHVYGSRLAEICRTRYPEPVVIPPPGWHDGADRSAAVVPEPWRPYF